MSDNTHPRIEVTATGVTIEKDPHTAPIHIPDSVLAANSAMVRHLGESEGAARLTLTLLAGSFVIESTPRAFWETSEQPRLFTFQEVCDHLAKRVKATITNPDGTPLDPYQVADWVDDLTKDIDVAQPCPDCNDTGALHSPDGAMTGICQCPAGVRGTNRLLAAIDDVRTSKEANQ